MEAILIAVGIIVAALLVDCLWLWPKVLRPELQKMKARAAMEADNAEEIKAAGQQYENLVKEICSYERGNVKKIISIDDNYSKAVALKIGLTQKDDLILYNLYKPEKEKVEYEPEFRIIPPNPGKITVLERYAVKQIMFFREVGSVQYTTSVNGGGVNLAGAVVGGMVAGAAGAVIGSRQAVTSSTETHDDRKVVLKLNDGREKVYDYKYYDYFIKLIPEKEYSFVMAKSQGI